MAVQSIPIEQFLQLAQQHPVLDVRSSGEYAHAHIPGAHSLPLFTDEERKDIGTSYKQQSREMAVKMGLDAFGPKMRKMVEETELLLKGGHTVLVHCWRGGMRSSAVAWLLDFYGFHVYLLEGGYKAYRQWAISHWQDGGAYRILSGYTGAGKTEILAAMQALGEPVIDLEGIAVHKGSAFGGLDRNPQPSQEMFENLLAMRIAALREAHDEKPIWIEDESQRIGDLNIPHELFRRWAQDDVQTLIIELSFEERLERITAEYGRLSTEGLIYAIVRIKKRLGPLETKTAIAHLVEGDIKACFRILLRYYDKHYSIRRAAERMNISGFDAAAIAQLIQSRTQNGNA